MIASDVMSRVRSQFGDATGIQISDQDIFNWINDAARDIAYTSNLNQTRAEADSMSGQSDYTLPDDYLSIYNVRYQGIVLQALSTQEKDNFIRNADSVLVQGQQAVLPTHYWIWAQTITLYPTPQNSDQSALVCYYTRTPNIITSGSDPLDIPIAFHNTLLERVLQWAYEKDDDWQAASIKESQFQTSVVKLSEDAAYDEHEAYPHISASPRDSGDLGRETQSGAAWW